MDDEMMSRIIRQIRDEAARDARRPDAIVCTACGGKRANWLVRFVEGECQCCQGHGLIAPRT